jgi:nucleolar protein 14
MAKSSKRSIANGTNNKNNNKNTSKKNKMGPEGVAMKSKAPKVNDNPFESIWSKRKFDILGQKRKGETKRIGLARSIAIEKRKKTLLKEYEQSTKNSEFVDRRIGENDEGLDDFGKAILRSQRERQVVFTSPLII